MSLPSLIRFSSSSSQLILHLLFSLYLNCKSYFVLITGGYIYKFMVHSQQFFGVHESCHTPHILIR